MDFVVELMYEIKIFNEVQYLILYCIDSIIGHKLRSSIYAIGIPKLMKVDRYS